jgi:hypothetical protein
VRAIQHLVAYFYISSYGQAVHHFGISRGTQFIIGEHPVRRLLVYFSVLVVATPILDIHKVGTFKCLLLIGLNGSTCGESLTKFPTWGMRDNQIGLVPGIDPLGKAIGYALWQGLAMRSP